MAQPILLSTSALISLGKAGLCGWCKCLGKEKQLFEKEDELGLNIDPNWKFKFKFYPTTREDRDSRSR